MTTPPPGPAHFGLLQCLCWLLGDVLLMLALAWYLTHLGPLDKAHPAARPWYFPITVSTSNHSVPDPGTSRSP